MTTTPEDKTKLNELAKELCVDAGQRILKVPGIRAVVITLVGDDTPLGAFVYDKDYSSPDTVLAGITRLTDHIKTLTGGLTGGTDGEAPHDDVE